MALGLLLALAVTLLVRAWMSGAPPPVEAPLIPSIGEPASHEIAERLAGAVGIPTISRRTESGSSVSGIPELHAYLRAAYPLTHEWLEVHELSGGSLLYRWQGESMSAEPVALLAHMDVVPAEAQEWTYSPFGGVVQDGFVWGRGALDDKGCLIAIFEAVESLLAVGWRPSRTVYLAFGHDEEIGGSGAAAMAERIQDQEPGGLAFVLDEGGFITQGVVPGVERPVAVVGVAEKGFLTLLLEVHQPPGHASMPTYPTPIGRLSQAIARLERNPPPMRVKGAARLLIERVAPTMSFPTRLLFSNLWLFEPVVLAGAPEQPRLAAMLRTTVTPTIIKGGETANVIPSSARAVLNLRLLPGDSIEETIRWVRSTIADADVEVKPVPGAAFEASGLTNPEGAPFQLLERVLLGLEPVHGEGLVVTPYLVLGATDARHYQDLTDNILRILPFRVDSDELSRLHGVDERVSVENLGMAVAFYKALLQRLDQI